MGHLGPFTSSFFHPASHLPIQSSIQTSIHPSLYSTPTLCWATDPQPPSEPLDSVKQKLLILTLQPESSWTERLLAGGTERAPQADSQTAPSFLSRPMSWALCSCTHFTDEALTSHGHVLDHRAGAGAGVHSVLQPPSRPHLQGPAQ